ncbi:MAG: molybdate ABC transporter substrate-binding protein [Burkholderiaceae bacterium]
MQRRSLLRLLSGVLLTSGVVMGSGARANADRPLVVFAAASLRNVLDDMLAEWHRLGKRKVVVSYAGTSALARQIEQGAPADLLISADEKWMQYLLGSDLISADSVGVFARNSVVLVAPATQSTVAKASSDAGAPDVGPDFPLQTMLGDDGRFAMADPAHVPAGRYGRRALESVGLFDLVQTRLTRSANVRLALALVARGECPAGLVYASDAHAEPAVRVMGRFAPDAAGAVTYPIALVNQPDHDTTKRRVAAASLLAWLLDPMRSQQLETHGLLVPSLG